jgi:hypothetical protein
MQGVPALLASLHHLSAYDHPGDKSAAEAVDRERAEQERQRRGQQEQQEIDQAAALRFRQFQQAERNRAEQKRRRAMQAAAARAREELAERDFQQAQADRGKPAQSQPPRAAGPAAAATSAAPPVFRYQVHACIAATSADIVTMIAESDARTRRLQQDLATKRQEEALKR